MAALRSYKTEEASGLTGIPQRTLEDLRIKGTGPKFLRLGKSKGIRYLESDLLEWMHARRYGSLAEANSEVANAAAG